MVVVEGEVVNGLFQVVTIGFPPPEPRYSTFPDFPGALV
jgi:hypothetical protein